MRMSGRTPEITGQGFTGDSRRDRSEAEKRTLPGLSRAREGRHEKHTKPRIHRSPSARPGSASPSQGLEENARRPRTNLRRVAQPKQLAEPGCVTTWPGDSHGARAPGRQSGNGRNPRIALHPKPLKHGERQTERLPPAPVDPAPADGGNHVGWPERHH